MQNVHYTTELLHVLSTGLGEAHGSRKALQLIFSFSWKPTAVKLLMVAQQTGSLKEN